MYIQIYMYIYLSLQFGNTRYYFFVIQDLATLRRAYIPRAYLRRGFFLLRSICSFFYFVLLLAETTVCGGLP